MVQKDFPRFLLHGPGQGAGPIQKMLQTLAGDLHAFGSAGAARGEDDILGLVRGQGGAGRRFGHRGCGHGLDLLGRHHPIQGLRRQLGTEHGRRRHRLKDPLEPALGHGAIHRAIGAARFGASQKTDQHPSTFVAVDYQRCGILVAPGLQDPGGQAAGIEVQFFIGQCAVGSENGWLCPTALPVERKLCKQVHSENSSP